MTVDDASSPPPDIAISRASTESKASSSRSYKHFNRDRTPPRVDTDNGPYWGSWKNWSKRKAHSPDVEWHLKWTPDCFVNGRVLIIDYISNEAVHNDSLRPGNRHVAVAAAEFQSLKSLEKFYADPRRAHSAALRVIHVQNATWATHFLLQKFNIDHPSELVGMQGFNRWARYETPRQRNGKPFPHGRSFREQTDPWRNISRTAFGLDYLKVYHTEPPNKRKAPTSPANKPIDALMMHLNAYDDSKSPHGYDVSVQRLSVYVQRSLGPPARVSPDIEVRNPYAKHLQNGRSSEKHAEEKVKLESLDNSNTVIVFETSASLLLDDCLVQPRQDFERRWRRLSFYLKKEDVLNDARLAAQCTNLILSDVFHGLAVIWDEFLIAATDHVNILEDKIYENPADESRAPELWTNQAHWLKVDKIIYMHQDLVREMQTQMRQLAEVDDDEEPSIAAPDWLAATPAEYDRLGHSVQEDLVQPTTNLSDLMYKSVGIRDSRQSLQLGLSMWRLSWITFIFLPLTFVVSFFGMNVNILEDNPSIVWWVVAAVILMVFVLFLWYCVKHSLQRRRQSPYERGLYEQLFATLEDEYPLLWSSSGAVQNVEPKNFIDRMKWRLLKRWFAPEKTINKKTYNSLIPSGDDGELGGWARIKRGLLRRWLPQLLEKQLPADPVALVELGRRSDSIHSEPVVIGELAKMSTPIAIANAEPLAAQQVASDELRPLSKIMRSSSRHSSEERPSSRGSSGIIVEERNLSDSESEVGEGAHEQAGESQKSTASA